MMNALNYLPLPLVKALAFFREELSEERPGRVPQTMQLWVGCLLVVLISMTFEIPFLALSLAVLFLRHPVQCFLYQIRGDPVRGGHGDGDRQLISDLQMVL